MIRARTTTASASWAVSGSEIWRGPGLTVRAGLLASVATLCLGSLAAAQTLPTGGTVARGDVSIAQPGAGKMTITQGSNSAVVNWNSFSIGSGAHVDIRQPGADASILNRVTGDTTSAIHGRLTANGQVHLVNPNGIFIGRNGTVDAGAFVASTLDITDEDFTAGRLRYRGLGTSATVENAGRVSIGRGGYAALLGGRVRNSGVVTVPMGRIAFGSGERAVLDLAGDQFLQVAVPTGGEDGEEALIENSGRASAQGGLIEMRAATAREAVRQAVNMTGVAEARSVSVRNGAIVLGGGAGGAVNVSGRVSTRSAPSALLLDESPRPPKGPEITITGQRIRLAEATIDASGTGGGGLIRIGGDFAGAGDLPRADEVFVDGATTIRANALGEGDGGRVAIWSDLRTDYAAQGSVRGGKDGGDGGFFEVSSRVTLRYAGLTDRRAPQGKAGMLLLDPRNIVVNPGAGAENEVDIEGDLELGDVTLNTSDAAGQLVSDPGNITINADLDWDAATTLFLLADNDIDINGSITAPNGGLELDAVGNIGDPGNVNVDSFFLSSGNWLQFDTTAAFSANNFQINQSGSSFVRTAGGDGNPGNPFQIFDIYGLQGIGTYGGDFVLANDIDASGTANWINDVAEGFTPIVELASLFDGAGFTIDDLLIAPLPIGTPDAGLFAEIDFSGEVRDLTLTNADVVGSTVGVLAATSNGFIDSVRVQGSVVSFNGTAGGLVGVNGGTIVDSVADVSISGPVSTSGVAGGLVGVSSQGGIFRSHALGPVSLTITTDAASVSVGGLVGQAFFDGEEGPSIADSYAQGDVNVSDAGGGGSSGSNSVIDAGGFVGVADVTIERSYSSGVVSVSSNGSVTTGGFAAVDFPGTSTGNFWDIQSSGQSGSAIGTGLNTFQFQDTQTFIDIAELVGWDFDTTWAPGDTGFYPVNYTTSSVIFAQPDDFSIQYGLTPGATTTGSVAGGPADYVFGDDDDTLDTAGVFSNLGYPDGQTVGTQTFLVDDSDRTSANGVVYRVVDLPGQVDITPAPLAIFADDDTKTYGEDFTPTNFTVSGTLFFDDTVDAVDLESDGSAANSPVDPGEESYSIFAGEGGATGSGLENYDIFIIPGTLTILPAPLTITANDQTKTYGQAFAFGGTEFTITEGTLVEGDSVDEAFLDSAGTAPSTPVDDYAIEFIDGVSGNGLENYDISYVPGVLKVTPAPLTITPNDQTKSFGTLFEFDGTEFTAVGFVIAGDGFDDVFLVSDGAPAGALPGDYPILISGFTGQGLENYAITQGEGTMTVEGDTTDIVPRPPVVTTVVFQNPRDSIEGDGFEGPTGLFGAVGGQAERQRAAETFARVQDLSGALEIAANSCGESSGDVSRYLACLSDALDDFAGELDAISLDLPPGMENVAEIIRTARTRIDGAASRAASRLASATTEAERQAIRRDAASEARAALDTASNEIRKAITLVRVEDPELASLQRATITTVASAVDSVGIELTRVTDL